ncbi:MAG: sodium-translocating pyrophosphatase, partial [Aeromicrobium sp.]|nr:sodium-translocating pyrophosphatase [Aeromicrobium sp.]
MANATFVAAAAKNLDLSNNNTIIVSVVLGVGVLALIMAAVFRAEVLRADVGTEKMQEIGLAVQEGAAAYLARMFKTLAVFAVLAFGLLFLLPGSSEIRIGRSLFFLLGAGFSASIGYLGMWLATRANIRVAAAAQNEGREKAMRIAFRTGGTVGMLTVGLGLIG